MNERKISTDPIIQFQGDEINGHHVVNTSNSKESKIIGKTNRIIVNPNVEPNRRIEMDNNGENCWNNSNGLAYFSRIKCHSPFDVIPTTYIPIKVIVPSVNVNNIEIAGDSNPKKVKNIPAIKNINNEKK